MPTPDASVDFYRRLQRFQVVLITAGRRAWSRMGTDFDRSWVRIAPGLVTVTAAAQLAAARTATEYVPAVLAETGQPDEPDARVRPQAFAGVAADGRSLPGLLYGSVARAKASIGNGLSPGPALAVGGRWLDTLLQGAVTDAGRLATEAEIATRDGLGFLRMVNPPCCPRCAKLAGRWYRYDAGFKRHPGCDCSVVPSTREGWERLSVSPDELFESGNVRGLTKRETERLAVGDDRNKVINESRDMWRARIAEQRRIDKDAAQGATPQTRDQQARMGLEDLFASTRSRVDALGAMKANGFAE